MPYYHPALAVHFARKWASAEGVYNPDYLQYDVTGNPRVSVPYGGPGGDCTNFVSQCLHAGGWPMDYPTIVQPRRSINVWYYDPDLDEDAAQPCSHTWILAPFFASYLLNSGRTELTKNKVVVGLANARQYMKVGDVVQFSKTCYLSDINHTCIVTGTGDGDLNKVQVHQHGGPHTSTFNEVKCSKYANHYVWVWKLKYTFPK